MVFREGEREKINFLKDIQDREDYEQFKNVLRLTGKTELDIDRIINAWKKRTEARYKLFMEAVEIKSTSDVPPHKSWFECIVNPENKKLESMPKFHRYVAYLLANYDHEKCASILGMTRMSLWRWRKAMGYLE